MKILGIETSCDETAAAIIENGTQILSNVVVSQIDIHQAYGGVVPEIAARSHIEAILPVIDQSLKDARLNWNEIDAIAVTHTPGLLGSLLIGTLTARTLAILHQKPLYPIHHLKSHIYANWLSSENEGNSSEACGRDGRRPSISGPTAATAPRKDGRARERASSELPSFPLIALIVSGGHTQLIHMTGHNHFEIIGTTHDDAIGEVFDKIAKILGLPYPGGPSIAAAAETGDPHKYPLPHPKMPDYDFSFSGLKTAVLRAIQKELNLPISTPSGELAAKLSKQQIANFAASFQNTAIDILVEKLSQAIEKFQPKSVLLAGGVAANSLLREKVKEKIPEQSNSKNVATPKKTLPEAGFPGDQAGSKNYSVQLFFPLPKFSTDNAAMVASAAYFAIEAGEKPTDPYSLDISPRSKIN